MKRIFFYGLFMDADLLRDQGLHPTLIGPASLPGYQIRIGTRASLVPNPQSTSYGMIIDLPDEEATTLYSAPDVCEYVANDVEVVLLSDRTSCAALCYNLPPEKLGEKANSAYVEQLSALVLELGFPRDYASEIMQQRDA